MHSTSDSFSPSVLGRDQRGDQIVAGVLPARLQQLLGVGIELLHRLLDPVALARHARRVELPLDPVGPVVQPRRVLSGAPITLAITCDGYGFANASTNSHLTVPVPSPGAVRAVARAHSSCKNPRIAGR